MTEVPPGQRLFARYAYAPNHLGYCGPADAAALFELGCGADSPEDLMPIAARFTGVWPYLTVLAELAGIGDPLDERVVRAYWTGGPLLDTAGRAAFGTRLLERIGATGAGRYWAHLTKDLLPEAAPTHAFHVFGVYPWSRLLTAGQAEHPLRVLDSCRIRWARIVSAAGDHAVVRTSSLTWDSSRLGLGSEHEETVRLTESGKSFVPHPRPGEWVAVHWGWISDRLTDTDLSYLRRWTDWQLAATNTRLAAAAARAARAARATPGSLCDVSLGNEALMAEHDFSTLMAALDSPLIVVTTADERERAGCLVEFHVQSSIEPQRYCVWLSKANYTYRVALQASHLVIHFLTADDLPLAELFGTQTGDTVDKFAGLPVDSGPGGAPVLRQCPNWLAVRRIALLDEGGDHVCLTTEPVAARTARPFRPLRISQAGHLKPGHRAGERPGPPTERAAPA